VLSEYLVEGFIIATTNLGIPYPIIAAFITFRVLQNLAIFILVFLYYRKLGLNTYAALVGLTLLAWGMSHSNFNSDLSFNTYSDFLFYCVAALAILYESYGWVVPVTALAACNRETSGLIPVMLLAYTFIRERDNRARAIAVAALTVYVVVFIGLRFVYGPRPLMAGYGNRPGLDYLTYNLFHFRTYVQGFATLGILPFTALYAFRHWPNDLRAFFWAIVPIWILIHSVLSIVNETRYFLMPLGLVFIPGTLFGLLRYTEFVGSGAAQTSAPRCGATARD
jgi:hypothetical protein